jgi:signal peptidase II
MIEPIRQDDTPRPVLDIRVGSATNAFRPTLTAERSLAAGPTQWLALGLVAAAAVFADQLTKWFVSSRLDVFDEVDVLGPFSIQHVHNSGIAFGLFAGSTGAVILMTAVAIGALMFYFGRAGEGQPVLTVSVALILGGSVANLVDRVRLGYVTDFLHIDYWPAFNLADTFIVTGVVLLFVTLTARDRPRLSNSAVTRLPRR